MGHVSGCRAHILAVEIDFVGLGEACDCPNGRDNERDSQPVSD